MGPKKIILAVLITVVAVGTIFLVLPKKDDTTNTNTPATNQTEDIEASDDTEAGEDDRAKTYTEAQVSEHSTRNDCWTIINGSVYNLTSFINQHPGGDEILRACGKDGTTLFTQRETEDGEEVGSGTPHSSNAESQLERLKIGTLAQ